MHQNLILLLLSIMISSTALAQDNSGLDEYTPDADPAKGVSLNSDPGMDTISFPWSEVNILTAEAKILNVAAVVEGGAFPWIPVIIGTVAVGTGVYFLTKEGDDDDPVDCSFTASAQSISSSCGLSNGSISIQVNPPGDYSYAWSNGATGSMISEAPAGSYTVTITRTGTTCSEVVSATITNQNPSFDATISTQPSACDQQTGSATVTPSPPDTYTYQWSNGSTQQNQTGLASGNYSLTISAGGECEKSFAVQIGTAPFDATISFTTTPSTCGLSDGTAMANVDPPGIYTYTWSNGQSGAQASGLAVGSYTVTVSVPETNCSAEGSVMIEENTPDFSISLSSTPAGCGLTDGTATAIVDPAGDYTYSWSNGQSTPQATGLGAGTYNVTVSITGTTCSQEASVTVDELPVGFTVSVSSTPAGCGLTDGTVTAIVDPAGEYTYAWSNGQTTAQATGLGAGTYNVTVSITGTTCSQEASVTVDELSAGFAVSVSSTPSGCGLTDGTATAIVDPAGEYTYAWSNGQINAQATGLGAGTYNVTVSIPGTTCSQEASVTVDELPVGFTVSVSSTPAGCGMMDGTATAIVDPAGEYTYTWPDGQTTAQATGLGAGTYHVTVSLPGSTCSQEASVTVDELPAGYTVSVSTTPSGCGLTDGTATAMIDPPGEYNIVWSNGQSGPQATGLAAGSHSVSVTIPGSTCEVVTSLTVDQSGVNFTGVITTDDASCGLADGTATIVVKPSGDYMYAWSNGQTGPVADMLPAGTYSVIVTDINQCTSAFTTTINEDPPAYISIVSTTPGTCTGGGEISFTLTTPGAGPLVVEVTGPEGGTTETLGPGTYSLSSFLPVTSGNYSFTVYDQQIGTVCTHTVVATVDDNTPPLVVNDDMYTTPAGQSVFENALDNDSGLDIQMTDVSDEFGGVVTFNADGDFTFIPDPGFNGEATFTYTVTDACGNVSTGIVTIIVEQAICDFNVEFELTPASCGLEDGSVMVDVIEPGTYDYLWSNGDSGPVINAVSAGVYTVTITDINLGCDLEFDVELTENPAEHIDDIIITQPACGVDGEIQFTLSTNSQNPLVMSVSHPNGDDLFFLDEGIVLLSDYISLNSGDYTIEVFDAGAGSDCVESLMVTLVATPSLEIIAEAVIPPSEPTSMDGLVIIVAIVQGTLPYDILLNGSSWGLALDHTFQIDGLGAGEYTVQIIDATGCESNILNVLIPFPPLPLTLGTSIMQTTGYESNEEPVMHQPATIWRNVLTASLGFYMGTVRQEVVARYAVPFADHPGFAEMVYMMDIGRYHFKNMGIALQGGLGSHFEKREDSAAHTLAQPNFLILKASAGYTIAKRFRLYGGVEVRGWDSIEKPQVEIGLSIPFIKKPLRWGN